SHATPMPKGTNRMMLRGRSSSVLGSSANALMNCRQSIGRTANVNGHSVAAQMKSVPHASSRPPRERGGLLGDDKLAQDEGVHARAIEHPDGVARAAHD